MKDFPTYFTGEHALSMTMRDYFAAKIIGGYVAGMKPNPVAQGGVCADGFALNNAEALAKASYILADALMIAREL